MIASAGGHAADMEHPGSGCAANDHFPRHEMHGRRPDTDPVDPSKVPMRDRLRRNPIERNKDRQAFARCANQLSVLVHRDVSPADKSRVCLLRLGRQDDDVVNIELYLLRPSDRRDGLGHVFVGRKQPKATVTQGCQVLATGHEHHAGSGEPEPTAESSANRSGTDNDVARHVPHRNLAQWWPMDVRLDFRDLEAADLSDLDWSGGPEHLRAVAVALEASYGGEVALLVGCLPNDRLIAMGGVDFRTLEDAGNIWMLAVNERFQSLGVGAQLIAALERKIIDHGRPLARMLVEHDNPRARALYERLGYSEAGATLDSWPVAGGKTYVTACTIMERRLVEIHGEDAAHD